MVTNAYGSSGWVPGAYLEKPGEKEDDWITERAKRGEGVLMLIFMAVLCV